MRTGPLAGFFQWVLVAAPLVVVSAPARAQLGVEEPLTVAEEARLEAGETVVRPVEERRGVLRLVGGTSFQVVDAPPEQVWAALVDDAGEMKFMLPQVRRARLLAAEGTSRTIGFHHRIGPVRLAYALRFEYRAGAKLVIFQLDDDRPHAIRAAWGFLRLQRRDDGTTLLSFGTMVDLGTGILSGAVRSTVHEWILKIPLTMKQYIEGRGRRRYARAN